MTSIDIVGGATPNTGFPSQTSFVQRLLQVEIQLAAGNSGSGAPTTAATAGGSVGGLTGGNVIKLKGSRTKARISYNSGISGGYAEVRVFGLTPTLMNQLSTLGVAYNSLANNVITISAGDAVSGLTPVFIGTVVHALGDYNSMPDVPLVFTAQVGAINAVLRATPSNFPGVTDVATIMAGIARLMGAGFENNGVNIKISNPYYPGTLKDQMDQLAAHALINAKLINNVLCIWPRGGSRTSQLTVPLISAKTGMIGYPTFMANPQGGFMFVKTIFNPRISLGTTVQVQTNLFNTSNNTLLGASTLGGQPQLAQLANKTWTVWGMEMALDSLVPHGDWMTTLKCFSLGQNPGSAPTGP